MNLHLSRSRRAADAAQRLELLVYDGCCQYPGCEEPLDKCDIHHIVAFIAGGGTDIENLVPMCRHHHRLNDDGQYKHPRRGHMSTRSRASGGRSGWAPPTRGAGAGSCGDSSRGDPCEHNDAGVTSHGRSVRFNDAPAARRAAGYADLGADDPGPGESGA